ncbi:MAG: ABC transporter substrate-binding protein [Candidatus Methylacidiphilales bacterium]|nr:ABC transporter substrate-binding protein [Candidatus Methylacidiphilales bacterium]
MSQLKQLRLGLFTGNVGLHVLSNTDILEKNLATAGHDIQLKWVNVDRGDLAPDLIAGRIIHLGGTGSTPPITSQSRGLPIVYVASSVSRSLGGFVVRKDSSIQSIADLRGKTISLALGAWPTQVLAVALDRHGLSFNDLYPINVGEFGLQALEEGGIDAIIGGIPQDQADKFRYIARVNDFVSNPSVYTAHREFAENHTEVLKIVAQSLNEAEHWVAQEPSRYAALVGRTSRYVNSATGRTEYGLRDIAPDFIDEQQRSADILLRFGFISRRIRVADAVLPFKLLAARELAEAVA